MLTFQVQKAVESQTMLLRARDDSFLLRSNLIMVLQRSECEHKLNGSRLYVMHTISAQGWVIMPSLPSLLFGVEIGNFHFFTDTYSQDFMVLV